MLSPEANSLLSLRYSEALIRPAKLSDMSFILENQDLLDKKYTFGQLWAMGDAGVKKVRNDMEREFLR